MKSSAGLIKILGINLFILIVLLIILEITARVIITYHPSYYTGVRSENKCVEYPYGDICFNSDGFPSSEFVGAQDKPTIGYFGDSVCFGVGAGMGYRVTDLLQQSYPEFYHRNYCYIGDTPLLANSVQAMQKKLKKIDHLVIFFNLNDIAPLETELLDISPKHKLGTHDSVLATNLSHKGNPQPVSKGVTFVEAVAGFARVFRSKFYPVDEFLRGRLFIYNLLRTSLKTWLSVQGIEATGFSAKELFPQRNLQLIEHAAQTLNGVADKFHNEFNVQISVVLLPYEMQISKSAANVYREVGIQWEEEFLGGSTQQILRKNLNSNIRIFDAKEAFLHVKNTAQVGEYFVYDLGDKLDWNHPNRKGHQLIHDFLVQQLFLVNIL